METIEFNSSAVETDITIIDDRKTTPLEWVQNDSLSLQDFGEFFGNIGVQKVTADLSQITNLQKYIQLVANAHIGNKVRRLVNFNLPKIIIQNLRI